MAEKLEVIITADDQASKVFKGLGGVLKGALGIGIGAATVAVGALAAGLGISVKEAMEAQEVQAQLAAVLKSTGGQAGVTADMAIGLADSLTQVTRYTDEAILGGENMLLTFTNIGKDVFPEATKTILDMSTALGQDLQSSAMQLGKALNDPIQGVTALRRVGVQFTDAQEEMIKKLVESGDLMGAQTIILDELQKEFGGSAMAAGQTFAGQLDILKNSLSNVAEGIGMALLPAAQQFVNDFILPALPLIKQFGEQVAAWITGVALPAIQKFGEWFVTVGWPAISNFAQQIWAWLLPALQQLGKWISDLAAFIMPLLADAIAFVTKHWNIFKPVIIAVGIVIAALNAPIALIIGAIILLAKAWSENWGGIQEKTRAVTDFIRNLVQGFLDALRAFWQAHGEQIKSIAKAAWEAIQERIRVVTDIIKTIFDAFRAAFEGDWYEFGQKLREAWIKIWDLIKEDLKNAWAAIKNIISNLISSIINFFKNTDWGAVGRAIIQGIANGISAATSWIVEAARKAAQAALDAAKGLLGIKSPSRVFIEVGKNMMAGMALGIDAGARLPVAAMAQSASSVTNAYAFYGGINVYGVQDRKSFLDELSRYMV